MDFQTFKKDFLGQEYGSDVVYSNKDLPFQISFQIKKARLVKGFTQKELAEKMETKQESIARAENGSSLPSLSFLVKMANAFNSKLIMPLFDFMANDPDLNFYNVETKSYVIELKPTNRLFPLSSFEESIDTVADSVNNESSQYKFHNYQFL